MQKYFVRFSQEGVDGQVKDRNINIKAFVEGHEYAMIIQKDALKQAGDIEEEEAVLQARDRHFALLDEPTRRGIMDVEIARQKWRRAHLEPLAKKAKNEDVDLFKSVFSRPKVAKKLQADTRDGATSFVLLE